MNKVEESPKKIDSSTIYKITFEFSLMWIMSLVGMAAAALLPGIVSLIIACTLSLIALIFGIMIVGEEVGEGEQLELELFYSYLIPFLLGFGLFVSAVRTFKFESQFSYIVMGFVISLFLCIGLIGTIVVKKDLKTIGKIILFSLLFLISLFIILNFFPENSSELLFSVGIIFIFGFFTVNEFENIKNKDIKENEITGYALKLYLSFTILLYLTLRSMFMSKEK